MRFYFFIISYLLTVAVCQPFVKTALATPVEGPVESPPVVAVLFEGGPHQTPIIALLEEKLSQSRDWVLVERERIKDILKEQKLAMFFGAESVRERIKFGRLLGADLLLLVSFHEAPMPHLRIVISETKQGLRIRNAQLFVSDSPGDDVDGIQKELELALKKLAESIEVICAVPSFINQDLSRKYEHLQSGYARMIQTMLLQMPGIIVVETAEARAIAEEISLTGAEDVKRDLPLYFLGEFRYDRSNLEKPPLVRIRLKRGQHELAARRMKEVSVEETHNFLRRSVLDMFGNVINEKLSEPDRHIESQILAKRAKVFYDIGHYQEATSLIEASLLIDRHDVENHLLAMLVYAKGFTPHYSIINELSNEEILKRLHYSSLAAGHAEYFLRNSFFEDTDEYSVRYSRTIGRFKSSYFPYKELDQEIRIKIIEYNRSMREMFLRVIKDHQRKGTFNSSLFSVINGHLFESPSYYDESLKENLQFRENIMPLLLGSEYKYSGFTVYSLVEDGFNYDMKKMPEYSEYLNKFDVIPIPQVRERIHLARLKVQKILSWGKKSDPQTSKKTEPQKKKTLSEIQLVPIHLKSVDGRTIFDGKRLMGLLNCGDRTDLVWGWDNSGVRQVFLMKQKGVLQKIFETNREHNFGQPVYDGERVWITITGPEPRVLAYHLKTKKQDIFTKKDGLPDMNNAAAASIGSGRICLAGNFGYQNDRRSFIAVLKIKESGEHLVRIIHEAKKQYTPNLATRQQYDDPYLSFMPRFMISQPKVDGNFWQVVLARSLDGAQGFYPALLIDPDIPRFKVMKAGIDSHIILQDVAFRDYAVYWGSRGSIFSKHYSIWRLGVDSKDKNPIAGIPEDGKVVFFNNQIHLVGKSWWISDGFNFPFRKVMEEVPGRSDLHRFFKSNHYGLIFLTSRNGWKMYQVELSNSLNESVDQKIKVAEHINPNEIHSLVAKGDVSNVRLLIKQNRDFVNLLDVYGKTPLHISTVPHHDNPAAIEIVRMLIDHGADIHYTCGFYGITPIFMAAYDLIYEKIKLLIEKGANVNACTVNTLETPLFFAIRAKVYSKEGRERLKRVVELLIENGADIKAMSREKETLLHKATEKGYQNIIKFFVSKGLDINQKDAQGKNPLYNAVIKGELSVIEFLLDHGADVNAQTMTGETPLYKAASRNKIEIVKILLQNGADKLLKTHMKKTPLDIAKERNYIKVIELLE